MKSDVFFGGVPTEPDVRRIREAFPDSSLSQGMVIEYAKIEELIGETRRASRFLSVTNRWRKMVEHETDKIIRTRPGVGFLIITEADKVDFSVQKTRSAVRSSRRAIEVIMRTDRKQLTEEDKKRAEHIERTASSIAAIGKIGPRAEKPNLLDTSKGIKS